MRVVHRLEREEKVEEPTQEFVWGVKIVDGAVHFMLNGRKFLHVGVDKKMASTSDYLSSLGFTKQKQFFWYVDEVTG